MQNSLEQDNTQQGQDEIQNEALALLREAVEQKAGHKMLSPKDFVLLSELIVEATHQNIGANTLKRIWGYLDEKVTPRLSTLNILAQYVGAEGWEAWTNAAGQEAFTPPTDGEATARRPLWVRLRVCLLSAAVLLLLSLCIGGGLYAHHVTHRLNALQDSLESTATDFDILRQGDTFATYDDYLRLFGLTNVQEFPYFQVLPHHPFLVLWGPEYHNAHWTNDGDSATLLPTITERWAPRDTLPECIVMRNAELFYNGRRNNDIRLTFMKNLTDTGFVFIGVYRFSLAQSDTTHIVWERVAEECDLRHLDLLERLRN